MNRRNFMTKGALSAAGLMIGAQTKGNQRPEKDHELRSEVHPESWMNEVRKYRKIDSHGHLFLSFLVDTYWTPELNLYYMDKLGIDKMMVSCPLVPWKKTDVPTPEAFRKRNDMVIQAVKQHPDRFIGTMVFNPEYQKESLAEIDRCVNSGMVGAGELYNQVKINDPLYYPIVEKFIGLKMLVMMHTPIGYSRVNLDPTEPKGISLPEDFVDIAKRYPEAMFQFAHIAGGIDWEYACKTLQDSPNIYVGTGGSNNEADMIDFAMKYIGEDRLVFGCDCSFYQSVGHIFSARLTEEQRRKIFFENFNNILRKSGNNVD